MLKIGTEVKILAEVSDGKGDTISVWTDGTVVAKTVVPMGMRSYGTRPGVIINTPDCVHKDKNIFVSDDMIDWVVCSRDYN